MPDPQPEPEPDPEPETEADPVLSLEDVDERIEELGTSIMQELSDLESLINAPRVINGSVEPLQ